MRRWKIFVPISVLACGVLIPVYVTQGPGGASSPNNLNITNLPVRSSM